MIRHLAYIEPDLESMRRGGSSRKAVCLCGWKGPERGTLELAADDALEHERVGAGDRDLRVQLLHRIEDNKAWLSKNANTEKWKLRRECQANLDADEQALAKLDADDQRRL